MCIAHLNFFQRFDYPACLPIIRRAPTTQRILATYLPCRIAYIVLPFLSEKWIGSSPIAIPDGKLYSAEEVVIPSNCVRYLKGVLIPGGCIRDRAEKMVGPFHSKALDSLARTLDAGLVPDKLMTNGTAAASVGLLQAYDIRKHYKQGELHLLCLLKGSRAFFSTLSDFLMKQET